MLNNFFKRLLLPLLIILLAFGVYQYLRPVPSVTPVSQIATVPQTKAINLPWPGSGQEAIGAHGYGVLASHNTDTPVPIASIAKIITALAVLKQKPLTPGSQGPTITLNGTDVDLFNYYYSKNGSVAQVTNGEQISEFQALETMLLPSANNMADSLARWAFVSVNAYITYANQMVKTMGLNHTTVGDANGFTDTTTSTADDLVKLGIAALDNPTIAQMVNQSSAQVTGSGTIKNTNWLLGTDGVVGIKTGNTDKAGGCYLFAAQRNVSGRKITLVGAVLAVPQINDAISAAKPLIEASDSGFQLIKVAYSGQTFGYYESKWGTIVPIRAAKDLSLLVWKGQDIKLLNKPTTLRAPQKSGANAGTLTAQSGQQTASSSLVLGQDLSKPSWHWKIFRK